MQDSWDSYRRVIEDLYLKDDKSLKEVMSVMEQNYGFQASKSQYYLQFKKWNLRKNLNENEWRFIHYRLEKRKRQGKESEVSFNNTLVPVKKVKKEISRHIPPTFEQGLSSAPSPETPQEISVHTPIAMKTAIPLISLENLPWFQCIDFVEIQVDKGENELWADQNYLDSPNLQWNFELDLEAMLYQENPMNFVTNETPQTLLSRFAGPTWPSTNSVEVASRIFSQLQATFCERYSGELMASIQCILNPFSEHSLTQLFKFAVYLASNNLLSGGQANCFLQWLIDNGHRATLRSFLNVKLPTTKAFANNIFPAALMIGDMETIQILVNAGVDLNRLYDGSRTPLGLAITSCPNIDIIRILLLGGADVNRATGRSSPLNSALIFSDNDVVQLLLDFGANVNARSNNETALQQAARAGNIGLVQILLDAGADVNEHVADGTTVLHEAVWENEIELVRLLVDFGANLYEQQSYGTTIFEVVSDQGTPEMMQLLLSLVPKGVATTVDIERVQLQAAVLEGDPRPIKDFLRGSVDVEVRNSLIWTAVGRGRLSLVQLLLDEGANFNYEYECLYEGGGFSVTLLHEAIFCTEDGYKNYELAELDDRVEVVRILLAAGADMNALAPSSSGDGDRTPIQAAAEASNLELVRLLLDAGADVNAPAAHPDGMTALQAAVKPIDGIEEENIELVQLLLKAGAKVNAPAACPYGWTALQAAVVYRIEKENHLKLVEILLDAGADINAPAYHTKGISAVTAAAQYKDLDLMRLLLRRGGDVNVPASCGDGRTPLQEAAVRGNIAMTQLLLSAGANVNAPACCVRGSTALQAAINSSSSDEKLELVSILLSAGADVNAPGSSEGSTALQAAAKKSNLELVQLLLKEGANINALACQEGGRTALQAAAEEGNSTMIQFLLKEGANVNAPASHSKGRTALQAISAAHRGNLELVQMLLDAGAEVNARAAWFHGLTALQGAAIRGHIQIAIVLLENGADVNAAAAAKGGRTALEGAAEHGRLDMVQLLLNAGADSNKPKESRYLSAVSFARGNGQPDTAELLMDCRKK